METLTTQYGTPSPAELSIRGFLLDAGFVSYTDGWFYPAPGPHRALVRFSVFGGQYQLQRRRKLTSPWMVIVVDDATAFDSQAFDSWRTHHPLTAGD